MVWQWQVLWFGFATQLFWIGLGMWPFSPTLSLQLCRNGVTSVARPLLSYPLQSFTQKKNMFGMVSQMMGLQRFLNFTSKIFFHTLSVFDIVISCTPHRAQAICCWPRLPTRRDGTHTTAEVVGFADGVEVVLYRYLNLFTLLIKTRQSFPYRLAVNTSKSTNVWRQMFLVNRACTESDISPLRHSAPFSVHGGSHSDAFFERRCCNGAWWTRHGWCRASFHPGRMEIDP